MPSASPPRRLRVLQPALRSAAPFMKWVGGKGKLLGQLQELMPTGKLHYAEPFLGGGAMYYSLWNQDRLASALLCDLSPDVVAVTTVLRDHPEELLLALDTHDREYMRRDEVERAAYFYLVRERHPTDHAMTDIERAARMLFLNRTCFNGLWRENSRGRFNSPHGRYPAPNILNEVKLRAAHEALREAEVLRSDFRALPELVARRGIDFVYLDPPYHPVSLSSSFNAYSGGQFPASAQAELAEVCRELDRMGVRWLLSNSDCSFIRDLYRDFDIQVVRAPRAVNCKADKRGDVDEVAVRNYAATGRRLLSVTRG
ncbi:MAG: DNA adenine methylase [Myxococcota bacterium]